MNFSKMIEKMPEEKKTDRVPGVCIPWQQKREELPKITGDEELLQRIWQDNDALAYVYIWQCLLSF